MSIPLAPAGAAAAYRAAEALPQAATQGTGGAGFGAALTRAMEQAVDVGREADASTTRALTGQGSVTDVVLAVGRAELTLQTAVAVRDRVVAAYQDVMRMPI
ncbi:flagellar hook-basal body complex protein FliE [Neoroseomonas soli]|uniref:Flagellar hook-basal body complex protein FliE n=1 Tax=Neoroseomonas soli TaxID=1081025 RepID=A0A9X9WXE5_9PROT|nr:flagellar hook-basal body complex protein FliE [Neoroseomonas soli]MBR0671824.1 flagellar hook-basal body complex protein FliE [Neoroseomonas soli]